jgi:periplasmic protein TonB
MKSIISSLSFSFLLFGLTVFAQPKEVEVVPTPVGGIVEIVKNVIYPEIAKINKLEGKVIIKAIVDEQGNVSSTEVVQSLSIECDQAAIDAIKKVKFTPALRDGKAVKSEVLIPVQFKLC